MELVVIKEPCVGSAELSEIANRDREYSAARKSTMYRQYKNAYSYCILKPTW